MNILISGASSTIAKSLIDEFLKKSHSISVISRSDVRLPVSSNLKLNVNADIAQQIGDFVSWQEFDLVICCNGLLFDDENSPEKSLEQVTMEWLHKSLEVNVMSHLVLAQVLEKHYSLTQGIRWISLSAMVGSIEGNRLGGWYSYRMSKASLNMAIRNLSIEWRRKFADSCVVALHPGTTQSPLTKPFNPKRLYSPQQTAKRLIDVIENLKSEQSGQLLNWDGKRIPF